MAKKKKLVWCETSLDRGQDSNAVLWNYHPDNHPEKTDSEPHFCTGLSNLSLDGVPMRVLLKMKLRDLIKKHAVPYDDKETGEDSLEWFDDLFVYI